MTDEQKIADEITTDEGAKRIPPRPEPLRRVLILEDEPDLMQLFCVACQDTDEDYGFIVECVSTIQDALTSYVDAKSEHWPYDLLILDIRIKGDTEHTGIYVAQCVRESGDKKVKIIFLTALDDEVLPLAEQTLGVVETWRKPIDAGNLPEMIAKILNPDVPISNRRFHTQSAHTESTSPPSFAERRQDHAVARDAGAPSTNGKGHGKGQGKVHTGHHGITLETLHLHRRTHRYLSVIAVTVGIGLMAWLALYVRAYNNSQRIEQMESVLKERAGYRNSPILSFTASVPKNLTALPERSSHGWQDVKIRVHSRDAVKVRSFFSEAKHRDVEFRVSLEP